ncbi:MAG: malto-oligosyltrehalose trehalohydrolase [Acidobacteriaceae bacterium]
MRLELEGSSAPILMERDFEGWHETITTAAHAGSLYRFLLPDGTGVPDPASRFQPKDVHGPSEVIDPSSFVWHDSDWSGLPWAEAVLYELHVGAFTEEGTFLSAMGRLDHLAALGVTAIELMCLADFAGTRNWGYDGVLLYAPDSAYGRPEDLKAFVDAAHERGLMVLLDVVYNHFGPEGNYMSLTFPQICTDRHCTPWGQGLNFDGEYSEQVRELIVHNALYWMEEFHVDGLRLDAAHAMIDTGPRHILEELSDRVRAQAGDRPFHLILENEQNIARRLVRDSRGETEEYTAQWNHDITHLLGAAMAGGCEVREGAGVEETEKLGKALAEGFVIAAQMNGEAGKNPAVPPTAFVAFLQTHDLIGNRIFGERIYSLAAPQAVRAAASIYQLSPQTPMMFMGDEFGASTPFPYFCDFHGELAEAVRNGRCEQLSAQDPKPSPEEMRRAPNPQADETFRSAKLQWAEATEGIHAEWLAWYKRLLRVRQTSVVPLLHALRESCGVSRVIGPGALTIEWTLARGARLRLAANLCDRPTSGFAADEPGQVFWLEGSRDGDTLGAWTVEWRLEDGKLTAAV